MINYNAQATSTSRMYRFARTVALSWIATLVTLVAASTLESNASSETSIGAGSATTLPNGKQLIIGGSQTHLASKQALLRDKTGASTVTLGLKIARAHHTATVLPDGNVLVLGGVDEAGRLVERAEIFSSANNTFIWADRSPPTTRAGHTVTVLTDGRLLITGGWHPQFGTLYEAELFDWRTGESELLSAELHPPRVGHQATLLPDGRVLILGGYDEQGKQFTTAALFDSAKVRFLDVDAAAATAELATLLHRGPTLTGSIPAAGTTNFPNDGLIALRFSKPLAMESVSEKSFTLFGPGGTTTIRVIGAEGGRLAFVTPTRDLFPGSQYTLFVNGAMDEKGVSLPFVALGFSTAVIGVADSGLPTPKIPAFSVVPQTENHTPAQGSGVTQLPTINQETRLAAEPLAPKNATEKAFKLTRSADDVLVCKGKGSNGANVKNPAFCTNETASSADGFFKPGKSNSHGRWRVSTPLPTQTTVASLGLPAGTTGVFGQVLRVDDRPLADVEVSIGKTKTRTNAEGIFVLRDPPVGKQELLVDGKKANRPGEEYGEFIVVVEVLAGKVSEFEHHLYMPRIAAADKFALSSPAIQDILLEHPELPGLSIFIPKGTVIKDRDGKVVNELAIVPMPIDRAPVPPPDNFPMYFSIQPGTAIIQNLVPGTNSGVRITYPNYTEYGAGAMFDFWDYDPARGGWYVYGSGKADADGHVHPDAGVDLYRTMHGGHSASGGPPPPEPPPCPDCCKVADPVSCSTGLFLHETTEVTLRDVASLALTRTHRQGDTVVRPFGIGGTHPFAMYIYNPNPGILEELYLIDPEGVRYRFDKIGGTNVHNFVWEHKTSPSKFYGAVLTAPFSGDEHYRVVLKDGAVFEFEWFGSRRLRAIKDRFNNKITVKTVSGRIDRISTPSNRFVTFSYDANNRISQMKDISGRIWSYIYNAAGYLQRATYPDLTFEEYAYDASGRMTTVRDRRGNTMVTNVYDAAGRVIQQTYADATIATFAYTTDANNKIIRTDYTDPRGIINRMEFNTDGHLLSTTTAFGTPLARSSTVARQSGTNLVNSTVDALTRRTDYAYDTKGNIISVTSLAGTPDAITETMTYTGAYNLVASRTDALNNTTTFTYDSVGQLTKIQNPLGHATSFTYNGAGQVLTATNALNQTTTNTYDLGDLRSVTDALSRTTTYATDLLGRIIAVTDATGNRTRTEYDLNDRATRITDANGKITTIAYTPLGHMLSLTDANTRTTNFTYNARNWQASRTDPLGRIETFTYDGVGNVTGHTDRKGQAHTYGYDSLGRNGSATYADGTTTSSTYDSANRLASATDSLAGTITRTYDGHDRLLTETTPNGTVNYAYDNANRRATFSVSGQPAIAYAWDAASRLQSMTQSSEAISYGYDIADRVTKITLGNGVESIYAYDNTGQPLSITHKKGTATLGDLGYAYDPVGRITSMGGTFGLSALPPATTTNAVFDANNRLTSFNGALLTYDNNGNLLTRGTRTYVWDARNRLKEIKNSGTTIATFVYDVFGRRQQKTINGVTTQFVYDGHNVVQEKDGAVVKANIRTGLGIDQFLSRTETATNVTRYPLTNHLGSVIALTDSVGSVTTNYLYEPYGNVTVTGEANSNTIQYTGRENDGTGLYFYRARYYDPQLMRFMSEDPIGLAGGVNVYAYVDGNPVSRVDPLGLDWGVCCSDGRKPKTSDDDDRVGASHDFSSNYHQMRRLNVRSSDKYFHCMANCQAAQRGPAGYAQSIRLGNLRELSDQLRGGSAADSANDQAANSHGREGGKAQPCGDCREICDRYRPARGLPPGT